MKPTIITPDEWASQYEAGTARTMDRGFSHDTRIDLLPKSATMYEHVYVVTRMPMRDRSNLNNYEAVGLLDLPDIWKDDVRAHILMMTPDEWNTYTRTHVRGITVSDIDWCFKWHDKLIAIEEKHNDKAMSVTQRMTYTSDLKHMTDLTVIPIMIRVYDEKSEYIVASLDKHTHTLAHSIDEVRYALNDIVRA